MDEQLIQILYEYGWLVVIIIAMLGYLLWVIKRKGKTAALIELREMAYSLMLIAEKRFAEGEGCFKMDWVIDRFYPAMPNTLKFIITRDDAKTFLQTIYDEARDYLDDGVLNDSN